MPSPVASGPHPPSPLSHRWSLINPAIDADIGGAGLPSSPLSMPHYLAVSDKTRGCVAEYSPHASSQTRFSPQRFVPCLRAVVLSSLPLAIFRRRHLIVGSLDHDARNRVARLQSPSLSVPRSLAAAVVPVPCNRDEDYSEVSKKLQRKVAEHSPHVLSHIASPQRFVPFLDAVSPSSLSFERIPVRGFSSILSSPMALVSTLLCLQCIEPGDNVGDIPG
ncbi:hypothetical protein CCMSSC00406_0010350 [Pleurotus cornucopiae]|uniref:Uncharacterized protein n=1 Tax=Pleurotus cornucopiae TaxID=5321 RepID=A0ACB7IHR3_PLECO|nr:hypothetical protein CCMSSC00406_0010350 [Pleurotus cornucopiae]